MFYEECHRTLSYLLDVLAPCQHFDVLLSNKDKSVQFITTRLSVTTDVLEWLLSATVATLSKCEISV